MAERKRAAVLVAMLAAFLLLPGYLTASAADEAGVTSIVVTTTSDIADAAFTCGAVTIATLPGPDKVVSLREALCAANSHTGTEQIRFALPRGSVTRLLAALPALTDDGTDVAGDPANRVTVDAWRLPAGSPALTVASGGNRIAGVALVGPGDGVLLEGSRAVRNRVEGMALGVSATETVASGLGGAGVRVRGGAATLIGGLSVREGNVISGAKDGGVVVERALRVKILGNSMSGLGAPGITFVGVPVEEMLAAPRLDRDSASTLTLVGEGVPPGATIDVFHAGPPGAPSYGRKHLAAVVEGGQSDADHARDGRFTFPLSGLDVVAGDRLTVTATDARGITSAFSEPVTARTSDADSDGLPDEEELARGLDPFAADTDGDGVLDGIEACRCSTLVLAQEPPALLEVSAVTGRLLRRVGLPAGAGVPSGFVMGRSRTGGVVAVATTTGVGVVDLQAEGASPELIPVSSATETLTSTVVGHPGVSSSGTTIYVPRSTADAGVNQAAVRPSAVRPSSGAGVDSGAGVNGAIAVIDLLTRRLVSEVGAAVAPEAVTGGEGTLMAATFPGAVGLYSVADPASPSLLFVSRQVGDRALLSDSVITVPAALDPNRFALATAGTDEAPLLVVLSGESTDAETMAVPPPSQVPTATVPVAVTAGPSGSQVSVALASPDGTAGGVVTLASNGTVVSSAGLPGRPAGLAVSGSGGLIVPLADGRVLRLTGPGVAPAPLVSVTPVSPSGVLGLAAPTTGTDANNASSGPGAVPTQAPGATPPVLPAALPGRSISSSGGSYAAPTPRPNLGRGQETGGLPLAGEGQVSLASGQNRPNAPESSLLATGVPQAPGGGYPLPKAVALSARPASAQTPGAAALVWVVAASCAAFLAGALAIQPRPGMLGPRRLPVPSWIDDPQVRVFGPGRAWERLSPSYRAAGVRVSTAEPELEGEAEELPDVVVHEVAPPPPPPPVAPVRPNATLLDLVDRLTNGTPAPELADDDPWQQLLRLGDPPPTESEPPEPLL